MRRNRYFVVPIFFWIVLSCEGTNSNSLRNPIQADFQSMKKEMVETQIRARGIKDEAVLNAMLKVDRHKFVPEDVRHLAYADRPLAIGEGQTISQPYIVALMTELLELKRGDRVLEVGTGSGYQAAILAELADHVYTIEIIESLARSAERNLRELGYKNIDVKIGDGYIGWEEFAPFDAIVVTCAPPHIPQPLLDQLKEGGRLVIPVGDYYQELKKITRVKGQIKTQDIIPVIFVPMTGEHVK
jgi:protein-L-isoaspartate(D-aspartate) O-methyltransferase